MSGRHPASGMFFFFFFKENLTGKSEGICATFECTQAAKHLSGLSMEDKLDCGCEFICTLSDSVFIYQCNGFSVWLESICAVGDPTGYNTETV